jgi:hypothetical protein
MSQIGQIQSYNEAQEQAPLDALPAGPYTLQIVESDCQHHEKAQGRRITVTYEVVGGPHDGRKGFDRFDIDRQANTRNGMTMIDLSRFKTLCVALGFPDAPQDTTQMHGITFQATAKVEQNDPNYAPQNRWGSYRPAGGAPVTARPAAAPPQQRAPVQAAGGGKMQWPGRR